MAADADAVSGDCQDLPDQRQQRSADPGEDDPELPATNESDVLDSRFLRRELGLQGDPPEDDEEPAAAFDFADAQFPDELMHAATRPGNALEPQPAQPPRIRQNKLRTRTRKPGAKPEPVAPPASAPTTKPAP